MTREPPKGWRLFTTAVNGDPMYARRMGAGVDLTVGVGRRPWAPGWPEIITVGKMWKRRRVLPLPLELALVREQWGLQHWQQGPSTRHLHYLLSSPLTPKQAQYMQEVLGAL